MQTPLPVITMWQYFVRKVKVNHTTLCICILFLWCICILCINTASLMFTYIFQLSLLFYIINTVSCSFGLFHNFNRLLLLSAFSVQFYFLIMKNIYVFNLCHSRSWSACSFLHLPHSNSACHFPTHSSVPLVLLPPSLSLQGSTNRTCKIRFGLEQSCKEEEEFVWRSDETCSAATTLSAITHSTVSSWLPRLQLHFILLLKNSFLFSLQWLQKKVTRWSKCLTFTHRDDNTCLRLQKTTAAGKKCFLGLQMKAPHDVSFIKSIDTEMTP
jgi:hypothetical protein